MTSQKALPRICQTRSTERSTTAFEGISNLPEDMEGVRIFYGKTPIPHVVRLVKKPKGSAKHTTYEKVYIGRIVDSVFYSNEDYRRLFKRGGVLRSSPLEAKATKQQAKKTASITADTKKAEDAAPKQTPAAPDFSSCSEKLLGATPMFWDIVKSTGLLEDLTAVYGASKSHAILSLAFYQIISGSFIAKRFAAWARDHYTPLPDISLNEAEIADFLVDLGSNAARMQSFFALRRKRTKVGSNVAFDSTNIGCDSQNNPQSKKGICKRGGARNQLSVSILYAKTTVDVLYLDVFEGNGNDNRNGIEMLHKIGHDESLKIVCNVFDRGYFSKESLEMAHSCGLRTIVAAKKQGKWVMELVNRYAKELEDPFHMMLCRPGICGITVEVTPEQYQACSQTVWLHLYKDLKQWSKEREDFLTKLVTVERKLALQQVIGDNEQQLADKYLMYDSAANQWSRRWDEIRSHVDKMGMFLSVSTWKCSAEEAYELYSDRDVIEKGFESMKTDLGMRSARAHSKPGALGRALLTCIGLSIIGMLRWRMSTKLKQALHGDQKRSVSLQERGVSLEDLLHEAKSTRGFVNGAEAHPLGVTQRLSGYVNEMQMPDVYESLPEFCLPDYTHKIAEQEQGE